MHLKVFREVRWLPAPGVALLALLMTGCGGGSPAAPSAAGPAALQARHPTYHGGPLLPDVRVCTLSWGPALEQSGAHLYLDDFLAALFADGRYMANLAQYSAGGFPVGSGRLAATASDAAPPPATVTDAQVQAEITAQVAAGKLPRPAAATLYLVLLPADVTLIDPHGFDSPHHFTGYHAYAQAGGFAYAVVIDASDAATTITASHELAESVTDPQSDTWATVAWIDDQYGEIGDIVQNLYLAGQIGREEYVDTLTAPGGVSYVVQKVWSVKDGAPAAFAGPAGAP